MIKNIAFLFFICSVLIARSQNLSMQKIIPDSVAFNQRFGQSVVIDSNIMVASSRSNQSNWTNRQNTLYIYERQEDENWRLKQVLQHPDPLNYSFGHSIAISDEFIFVKQRGITYQNNRINSVGVYRRGGDGLWYNSQELRLQGNYQGSYGQSIIAKGNQLIISANARHLNDDSGELRKQADIFELEGSKWVWKSEVVNASLAKHNQLKGPVSIEGNKVFFSGHYSNPDAEPVWFCTITVKDERGKVIGQKTSPCKSSKPRVYVYSDNNGHWENTQMLEPWGANGWGFGSAIAAHGDYLAIGASSASVLDRKNLGGAVYIFRKDASGFYQPFQRITANDIHKAQFFGTGLSMNDQYLIVGAKDDKRNAKGYHKMDRTGACFVFQKTEGGTFGQIHKLVSDKRCKMGHFGRSVALSGHTLIVGSGYKLVPPRYRGSIHDEGAVFSIDLTPIPEFEPAQEKFTDTLPLIRFEDVNDIDQGLTVFPNPTTGDFVIKRDVAENSSISIYSSNGQEVYHGSFDDLEQHFSLSGWAIGLYYIQVRTAEEVKYLRLVLSAK